MPRSDRTLLWAGIAAVASLVLSSGSLAIAIISIARPPVSEYLSAEMNAQAGTRMGWQAAVAAFTLACAFVELLQTVLRKPYLFWKHVATCPPASDGRMAAALGLGLVSLVWATWSIFNATAAIRAAGSRPITDSMAFSGISLNLGISSVTWLGLHSCLYVRWWHGKGIAADGVAIASSM